MSLSKEKRLGQVFFLATSRRNNKQVIDNTEFQKLGISSDKTIRISLQHTNNNLEIVFITDGHSRGSSLRGDDLQQAQFRFNFH